jgi:predicted MFS family arabinose efflux permease
MPAYAKDVLGGGPRTLGLLLSAAGAGALVSTLYLAGRATVRGLGRVIAIASLTAGLALAAFAYLTYVPLALLLMIAVGAGVILAAAAVSTILQTIAPDRLRGRISAFYSLAFLGMAPLGSIAAGALADVLGVQATFAANGLAAAAAALAFWRALPALRILMRPTYLRLGIIASDT